MPIETSLDIVGPTGLVVTRMDQGGVANGLGDLITHYPPMVWQLVAGSISSFIFTNFHTNVIFRLFAVRCNTTVAGGASAAAQLVVCPQGVALASGVNQLTAALDLTTTAPAKLSGTLITPPTDIGPGDSLGVVFTGTLTGLVGVISYGLRRIR